MVIKDSIVVAGHASEQDVLAIQVGNKTINTHYIDFTTATQVISKLNLCKSYHVHTHILCLQCRAVYRLNSRLYFRFTAASGMYKRIIFTYHDLIND